MKAIDVNHSLPISPKTHGKLESVFIDPVSTQLRVPWRWNLTLAPQFVAKWTICTKATTPWDKCDCLFVLLKHNPTIMSSPRTPSTILLSVNIPSDNTCLDIPNSKLGLLTTLVKSRSRDEYRCKYSINTSRVGSLTYCRDRLLGTHHVRR